MRQFFFRNLHRMSAAYRERSTLQARGDALSSTDGLTNGNFHQVWKRQFECNFLIFFAFPDNRCWLNKKYIFIQNLLLNNRTFASHVIFRRKGTPSLEGVRWQGLIQTTLWWFNDKKKRTIKRGSIHMKFSMTGQEKCDLLI